MCTQCREVSHWVEFRNGREVLVRRFDCKPADKILTEDRVVSHPWRGNSALPGLDWYENVFEQDDRSDR